MKIHVNGQLFDLPQEVIDYLRLSRYRDSRRKSDIISIRFTHDELQQFKKYHQTSQNWKSFSVFLHDILVDNLKSELASINKPSTSRRLRWWK